MYNLTQIPKDIHVPKIKQRLTHFPAMPYSSPIMLMEKISNSLYNNLKNLGVSRRDKTTLSRLHSRPLIERRFPFVTGEPEWVVLLCPKK